MTYVKVAYLRCPDCTRKRVTRRDFSDGDGYACDHCAFSVYIEEEGDQPDIERLAGSNPDAEIKRKYRYRDEEAPMVKTWRHSRKGLITGMVVGSEDGEFITIRAVGDQKISLASREGDPWLDDGDEISVRKSFLTEVSET